jgi:hypothetical protein
MSDQLVNNIRKENYPLQIYTAMGNNPDVIKHTTNLISFVQDVYRSIEPDHFEGQIVIYTTLDDSVLLEANKGREFFDKNILINNTSDFLILQLFQADRLPLIWENVNPDNIFDSDKTIIYTYQNRSEFFVANKMKIDIINRFDCASIYALQYHYLSEALLKYKEEKIRYSSCTIFRKSWFDIATRIYFKQKPEGIMQESLGEFLDSSLRGVDVVREYNNGASKPVDIRVYWKEANRAAMIELKWLGQSKDEEGKLSTAYANGRGNDGLDQVKEYMDLENQDTPTCITKGYLVIVDGRRRGVAANLTTIDVANGMHYRNQEVTFDPAKKFYDTMTGFENPIRMFAEPICN